MDICKLCGNTAPFKTNTHVFSHFLIKGAINKIGKEKGRGKEARFTIHGSGHVDLTMGKELLPEDNISLIGRALTDEEIDEIRYSPDAFAVDDLVCKACEDRFGIVENYFNSTVYKKLKKGLFKEIKEDCQGTTIVNCVNANPNMIRLFLMVQFWRASASKIQGWSLDSKDEERIRQILNACLGEDEEATIAFSGEHTKMISRFPMTLTYMETEDGTETKNQVLTPDQNIPHVLVINNLIIQLFLKKKHIHKGRHANFNGLLNEIELKENLNVDETTFRVGVMSDSGRYEFIKNSAIPVAEQFFKNITLGFAKKYFEAHNGYPTKEQVSGFWQEMILEDVPDGVRYSKDRIEKVSSNHL